MTNAFGTYTTYQINAWSPLPVRYAVVFADYDAILSGAWVQR